MSGKNKSNLAAGLLFAALCIPLALAGAGCCPDGTFPPCDTNGGPTSTTLVSETSSPPFPIVRNFNPTAANKTITATVTGNTDGSRPWVRIYDPVNILVAESPNPGTSKSVTVSFTSSNNGLHVLMVSQGGPNPGTAYTMLVTEQ